MKADAICKHCGAKLYLGRSKAITDNLRRSALCLFERGHAKCAEGVVRWPIKALTDEEAAEVFSVAEGG